ncbi:MAG TPA: hypothetical protein VFY45_03380 [Baekduia sp.]|nr:hypothetical protein [Baekduia sp.]
MSVKIVVGVEGEDDGHQAVALGATLARALCPVLVVPRTADAAETATAAAETTSPAALSS